MTCMPSKHPLEDPKDEAADTCGSGRSERGVSAVSLPDATTLPKFLRLLENNELGRARWARCSRYEG